MHGLTSATTGTTYGVYGQSDSTSGRGVSGWATAASGDAQGGAFRSNSTSGSGVSGYASAATGTTYGVVGTSNSTGGIGVGGFAGANTGNTSGVYGASSSTSGRGVFGMATNTTGTTYGVYGQSDSQSGRGVYGSTTFSSGTSYGVYGQTASSSGSGVYGWATNTSGNANGGYFLSDSPSGAGVRGSALAATGTTYGVRGGVNSSSGFGVYSFGDMGASGTKPFRIDHPFDPTGKYLLHYAAESPMPQNFYVGNVVTDAKGYAWVELPDYLSEINTNFKYQLTVVDDEDSDGFVMAKISKKILANRFQIRTSKGNVEVSWRVDADRNDLYVRAKKPKDVVEKQDLERGMYQHPELYGEPAEKGVNYRPADPGNH
ncbi:MAG TPA: hypothetical protein PLL78_03170 [Fimbriimonadaceae bacterium]|nr:hypothetical protein [Fimbriimonadaceae bacterium]HRJ95661.1 hypothetical protein [Fimbriimonadaceae bacterium]